MTRVPDLVVVVPGVPAPQGSKTAFVNPYTGKAGMRESSSKVKPWRQDVVYWTRQAIGEWSERSGERWTPLGGAVALAIEFYMPRPSGHPKQRRTLPVTKPDLDKLLRSTLDALTSAGAYRDDAQIVDLHVRERYAVTDEQVGHSWELPSPGAVISVFAVDPVETWADLPLGEVIAERLPVPELPGPVAAWAAASEDVRAQARVAERFEVAARLTDSEAVKVLRRAATAAKRVASGGGYVEVLVEDGARRLASIPRQPYGPVQGAVLALREADEAGRVLLILTEPGAPAPAAGEDVTVEVSTVEQALARRG